MQSKETSSSEDDSTDFDITSAFDSITFIEREFIHKGKQNGLKTVSKRSYNNGYDIGKTEGSKLGKELGFYHGFLTHFQLNHNNDKIPDKSKKSMTKMLKQINKISLSTEHLVQNDSSVKASMQFIRTAFKSLAIQMKFQHIFSSLDESDNSVPDSIKEMFQTSSSTNNLQSAKENKQDLTF